MKSGIRDLQDDRIPVLARLLPSPLTSLSTAAQDEETGRGTGEDWQWENSFVTKEGLNIEYIDDKDLSEMYMTFKTFVPVPLT